MKRVLIAAAVLGVAAVLAACGGGADPSSSSDSSQPTVSATVSAEQIGDAGLVLVDSTGKALYAADEEADGQVLCTDACLSFWTPLTITSGAPMGGSLPGSLGVTDRPDGTRQVTYDGKRLYSFTEDQPGEVSGDGFADAFDGQQFTWHVVHADAADDSTTTSGNPSGGLYG
jgi:predicted lipoprotein with Yx(FWY)xxD motif